MEKVFYRCNTDLFMKNGNKSFTSGKEYDDHCEDDDGISIRDDEGFMHHLGGWEVHFTRIERDCFEAHGLQWFRHTPGDPMPCAADAKIYFLTKYDDIHEAMLGAGTCCWSFASCIIGWRFADAETAEPESKLEFPSPAENDEMFCADMPLSAMDPGHLTQSQRKHIDAMEEKQAAKERLQRDAEADKQREHSKAMADAANAMDRVKQDHGHKLGCLS